MKLSITPVEDLRWLYEEAATELGVSAMSFNGGTSPMATDKLAAWCMPGWVSAPTPTNKHKAAARKQRRILRTLSGLSPRHKCAIECAYEPCHREGEGEWKEWVKDYNVYVARVILRGDSAARATAAETNRAQDAAEQGLERAKRSGGQLDAAEATAHAVAAKRAARMAAELVKLVPTGAARLLGEAHEAYRAAHRERRAVAMEDLQRARNAARGRREAYLAELLELPRKERNRAKAKAWLEEMGVVM